MQKSRLYQGLSCTVLGLSCLLLTSCTLLKTDYVNHVQATAPQGYGQLQNADSSRVELSDDTSLATSHDGVHNTSVASQLDFYRCYQDEKLNALIDQVLQHNYDLKSAFLTLRQAEVSLGLSRAGLHPTANAGLDASARRNFYNGDSSTRSSGGNLSISYELDLFGRLAADERSSFEQFKATAYDYKAMRLTLIQRASEYYWNYAYAKEALKMAQEQLEVSQRRLDLIKAMWDNGASDGLEYDQALVNHRAVEQIVYQRGYELTAAHNALTTLLGLYSDTPLDAQITDLALEKTRTPKIEVSLPATLLQQRPDLMAYEARVRAAYADVDLAEANFYPSFTLNAGVSGGSSDSLTRFLTDPVGSLGAAIAFPFLNFNELSLQKESALISRDQARLDFAQGFITAVEEVSNALNEMSYQEQLLRSLGSEYLLTKSNYERYLERYRYGSASISDVLDASDSLRSAETRLLSSKRDLLNASMTLMITLGGDSFTAENAQPVLVGQAVTEHEATLSPESVYDPATIVQEAAKLHPIESALED